MVSCPCGHGWPDQAPRELLKELAVGAAVRSWGLHAVSIGLVEGDSGAPHPVPTLSQPYRHRGQHVYPTGAAGPFGKKGLSFPVSTKALLHAMKTCFGVIDGQVFCFFCFFL